MALAIRENVSKEWRNPSLASSYIDTITLETLRRKTICAVCGSSVEKLWYEHDLHMDKACFKVRCHGETEICTIDSLFFTQMREENFSGQAFVSEKELPQPQLKLEKPLL